MNKKELAVLLSRIQSFNLPNIKLEQYPTESEIAADVLWHAYLKGDIQGQKIVDLGCGPGILGIGALALGAKHVHFVDVDKDALKIARSNLKMLQKKIKRKMDSTFTHKNVRDLHVKAKVVIQNPPFGVKTTHHDKMFLLKAMKIAPLIYSFHKTSTQKFVEGVVKDHGFKAKMIARYRFPLRKTMWYHMKKVHFIDVGVWRIVKESSQK